MEGFKQPWSDVTLQELTLQNRKLGYSRQTTGPIAAKLGTHGEEHQWSIHRGQSSHNSQHKDIEGENKTPKFTFRSIMERVEASIL